MLRDFKKEDIKEINALRPEQAESEVFLQLLKNNVNELTDIPVHSFFTYVNKKGKVISIMGCILTRDKFYEIIQLNIDTFLEDIAGEEKEFMKAVRSLYETCEPGRYQTYVRKDFPQGIAFAEAMGFEREGLMKKYIGNEDCYLYAIIKE